MTDSVGHHGSIAGEGEGGCGVVASFPASRSNRAGWTTAGCAGSRVSAIASMTGCAPAPGGLAAGLEPQGPWRLNAAFPGKEARPPGSASAGRRDGLGRIPWMAGRGRAVAQARSGDAYAAGRGGGRQVRLSSPATPARARRMVVLSGGAPAYSPAPGRTSVRRAAARSPGGRRLRPPGWERAANRGCGPAPATPRHGGPAKRPTG